MSGVNPVVLIQILMRLHDRNPIGVRPRYFTFTKNNRMVVHKETPEETLRRKSILSSDKAKMAEETIRNQLKASLSGRLGKKVWIDPRMKKVAVPIDMSTGETGFGVLPTGSRIDIPEGKFIRAFTYWERVNDIDLSCFALSEDGKQEEFSWRNMVSKMGADICYSGDQTSGYHGGSEYFDINVELFKQNHPGFRYIVFCDNVYSNINFSQCDCTAGFMIREEYDIPVWKGERDTNLRKIGSLFDPKTVSTSFKVNAESTFAYLFAIDLDRREMVWLNIARKDNVTVAGKTRMEVLLRYLTVTDVFNVWDLYSWSGEETEDPLDADILVTDSLSMVDPSVSTKKVVHSWDFEEMLELLQPK